MRLFASSAAVLLASSLTLTAQGPLTPPAAPAPTMKTLEQVEARTPISSLPFTITAAGSYYVTKNLQPPTNGAGIRVLTGNVTIDLNGFSLIGNGGATNAIIIAEAASVNVTVRNGILRGWGATALLGINNPRVRAAELRISENVGGGINVGTDAIVTDCIVEANGGTGIAVSGGSVVERCIATGNSGSLSDGISAGLHSIVRRCIARDNGGDGIESDSSLITECEAVSNDRDGIKLGERGVARSCQSIENGGIGIVAGIRALVRECVATDNRGSGISVLGDSVVQENRASNNGRGQLNNPNPLTAGIDSTGGGGSRIESNHTRDNRGGGIMASNADIVARNSSGGNSHDNFSPTGGSNLAPRQPVSNTTNPQANHEF